jgi:hypothetical protein
MDRHVTRRILHGLGANAYGQLVVIIIQLAGVPILLHAWGTQLYGEWLILAAIPTYLSMADLGFSQSAGNDMTAHGARRQRRHAGRVPEPVGNGLQTCAGGSGSGRVAGGVEEKNHVSVHHEGSRQYCAWHRSNTI